jgi:hypothetical protein
MKEIIEKSLAEKIKDCSATSSMLAEMKISKTMKLLGWDVTDNPYYLDSESGKFRELDVFGRLGLQLRENGFSYDIELMVESKSASGYHILLTNTDRFFTTDLDTVWLGDDFKDNLEIQRVLKEEQFTYDDTQLVLKKIRNKFYPKDSWVFSELQYSFFNSLESFYAFRETNLGTIKELNNSVVWKAFQELLSVNNYIRKRNLDMMLSDLKFYIRSKETPTPIGSALVCLENYLARISYIHPILVIDAGLWKLHADSNVEAIKYARLIQTDLYKNNYFWIDVVNRSHFDEYMDLVTQHTKLCFSRIMKTAEVKAK